MPIVGAPWRAAGFSSLLYCRNGVGPPGSGMTEIAAYANTVLGRRMRRIFTKYDAPTDVLNGHTATWPTWRCATHTSPNGTRLRFTTIVCPAEYGAPDPRFNWDATISGGATASAATWHQATTVTAGTTINPSDFKVVTQYLTVQGDTTYEIVLNLYDGMRVVGAGVWEMPSPSLDTTADQAVDSTQFGRGMGVEDADALDLLAAVEYAWKRQGSQYIAWSKTTGATAVATAVYVSRGTNTLVNLLDQSITAWASTSPGFRASPLNRGSFESNNVGTKFAAFCQIVTGAAGAASVQLHHDNSGTALVSLTPTTTLGWRYGSCNLDATQSLEKYDVMIKGPGGADEVRVYAVSLFDYVA